MGEHWQAGLDDTRRTLSEPGWGALPDAKDGVRVFDHASP
jgi:hypothetical protein